MRLPRETPGEQLKADGALRDWAYRRVNWLLTGMLAFLVVAFVFALAKHLRVMGPLARSTMVARLSGDRRAARARGQL